MWKFLKSLLTDSGVEWKEVVHDPLLGDLHLNEDVLCCEAVVKFGEQTITFQIGGEGVPDTAVLAHAHDIITHIDSF